MVTQRRNSHVSYKFTELQKLQEEHNVFSRESQWLNSFEFCHNGPTDSNISLKKASWYLLHMSSQIISPFV